MAWFKVDDRMPFHRKVLAAKNEAVGAWVRAGAWSAGEGTNGHIPFDTALTIAPRRVWDRLVAASLAHEVELGWEIHDFLKYNPTSEEVADRRSALSTARAEAGKKGGKQSGKSRRTSALGVVDPKQAAANDEANGEAKPKQTAKQNEANTQATGGIVCFEKTKQNEAPIPIPIPIPDPSPTPPETGGALGGGSEPKQERLFAVGTASAMEAVAAYEAAVASVTGSPCALENKREHPEAICLALNKYANATTRLDGLAWLRAKVVDWVTAQRGREQFTSGWAPKHFLAWLRTGCVVPASGPRLQATGTDNTLSPARLPMKDA